MGLDIIGVSNMLIKPVPETARAKVTAGKTIKLTELAEKVASAASAGDGMKDMQGILGLILVTNGLEEAYNEAIKNGKDELTKPAKIEVSPEGEAWENKEREDNGLEHIDWERSMAYYKTSESKEECVGRSYSGIGDFRRVFCEMSADGEAPLLPCEGFCYAEECDKNYRMMSKVWPQWHKAYMTVSPEKTAEVKEGTEAPNCEAKFSEHLDDMMMHCDDYENYGLDWEKEFFLRLAKCFYLGKTCGMVIYC